MAGIGALYLMRVRKHVPMIRTAFFAMLVLLHFVREKPVWHLLGRIDLTGGSTGYHRYRLIDACINRASEWWLVGTKETHHWGPQLDDVTGHFVLQCVDGGIWALILFVLILTMTFRNLGFVLRRCADRRDFLLVWGLGAAVFVHTIAFLGVSYFNKPLLLFLAQVAIVASLRQSAQKASYGVTVPRTVPGTVYGHSAV